MANVPILKRQTDDQCRWHSITPNVLLLPFNEERSHFNLALIVFDRVRMYKICKILNPFLVWLRQWSYLTIIASLRNFLFQHSYRSVPTTSNNYWKRKSFTKLAMRSFIGDGTTQTSIVNLASLTTSSSKISIGLFRQRVIIIIKRKSFTK